MEINILIMAIYLSIVEFRLWILILPQVWKEEGNRYFDNGNENSLIEMNLSIIEIEISKIEKRVSVMEINISKMAIYLSIIELEICMIFW